MSGKRYLVTGASRGIGAAVVDALARRGDRVMAFGRDEAALRAVAQPHRKKVWVAVGDLRHARARDRLVGKAVDALGGLDVLVQCAGVVRYEGVGGIGEDALREQLDVNLVGPLMLAQSAVEPLSESRGAIVNVTSTLAARPAPGTAAYAATKAAMVAWTKTFAAELAPRVRVNAVAPGVVDTQMIRQVRLAPGEAMPEDPVTRIADQLEALRGLHPLGRLGDPRDVAEAVLYLLDAQWVTGSVLTVDGGLTAC